MDESIGYAAFGKATLKQPQQQVALIFDEKTRQAEKRIGMSMTLFEKAGGGLITADGIDDLAVKLGVPAGVLKETVQSFNAKVRADGTAPEAVPPKSHLAAKLDMKGRLRFLSADSFHHHGLRGTYHRHEGPRHRAGR